MRCDFHSHFLPGIDDGARTPEQSVKILEYLKMNGIETVCATPHYVAHHETPDEFLNRRSASFDRLNEYIERNNINRRLLPNIRLGAEVQLDRNLVEAHGLEKLCITGTSCLLLELPFREFEEWMLEEIYNVKFQFKAKPILAHINRYLPIYKKSQISEVFFEQGFILQINCESTVKFTDFMKIKKIIRSDCPIVFGCDIHDPKKTGECGLEKMQNFIDRLSDGRIGALASVENHVLRRV